MLHSEQNNTITSSDYNYTIEFFVSLPDCTVYLFVLREQFVRNR
jgi:hypothetical protein